MSNMPRIGSDMAMSVRPEKTDCSQLKSLAPSSRRRHHANANDYCRRVVHLFRVSVSWTKSAGLGGLRMSATVPFLIGGRRENSASDRRGDVFNPSTGGVQAQVPFCTAEEIDRTVRCAADALPAWSETPAVERARVLFRFRERLQARFEELAALVTREQGKTLAQPRAEMQRGVEMVEFACGIPSLLMGQALENLAPGVDCETSRHPLGVCAGITPFNFPSMVPLWMFPVAIACGNTFVLKPSEKVLLSAVKLGELLAEAGLPPGVFNIVHGDGSAADALLTHPLVRAVSFVGSTGVARHVYEVGTAHGKRVQAAGGAKNHLIIMPDADLEQIGRASCRERV